MTYHALNMSVSSYEIQFMDGLQCYPEAIFSSDNAVGRFYLMPDPDMIWNSCGQNDSRCGIYYHDLGINESNVWDYTAGGCHPNDNGRILMAKHIIDYIDSL